MTEKEKMLTGQIYDATDAQLLRELDENKDRVHRYNMLPPSDSAAKDVLIRSILGRAGDGVIVNQPFYCDYGCNIEVGDRFFSNFNFTVLDEAKVLIGNDVFVGPNVSIYTACHSTDPVERNTRKEWAEGVTIGDNVWIGGSVTILPGVHIGDNVTIGAGSVVVRDIPADSIAVGNPCKVVKKLRLNRRTRNEE